MNYNNTFVDVPTIYYDVTAGTKLVVPMNIWEIHPKATVFSCFKATENIIIDLSTNTVISYIKLILFERGLVEID